MKTTTRKGSGVLRRPTASADRPGDAASETIGAQAEDRFYAPLFAPETEDRAGLFTGGATLH